LAIAADMVHGNTTFTMAKTSPVLAATLSGINTVDDGGVVVINPVSL